MKLDTLFNALTFGELSQHKLGGKNASGLMAEADYPKILSHLNLGMTDLHIKFALIRKELLLRQFAGLSTYILSSDNAISSGAAVPYIEDSVLDPFLNDVAKVYAAVDEDDLPVAVNDSNDDDSIYTLVDNEIYIKEPVAGTPLIIKYQGIPAKIVIPAETDLSTIDVAIPNTLQEALQCFIAARVYSTSAGGESNKQSGFFWSKYNFLCSQITEFNIIHTELNTSNLKAENNGWP